MLKKISQIIFVSMFLFTVAGAQTADGVKEKIASEKKSLSYGLVVDNSGSYRTIFTEVLSAVNGIIEAHQMGDEAFVVRFVDSDKISLVQDFTGSADELQSAADELFIEGGQTAILDSVYFSAKHLAEKTDAPNRQKALILITDGDDRKSQTKIEEVLKFLKDEKIRVYALGLSDGKIYRGLLEKLAKETGGKSFPVEKRAETKNIVKELNAALRAQ